MSTKIKNRLLRTAVLALFALGVGAGIGFFQVRQDNAIIGPSRDIPVAGVKIGGPFTLMNQDGETVTEKNYAGRYKLIYFGFTACPAICPTELAKMSEALKSLGAQGDTIQPLFITIDPERDDVRAMKSYVSLFHPRLQGLTGTPMQIEAVKKTYRVYGSKVKSDSAIEYDMNHSNYIYLMSPQDDLISVYKSGDTAQDIAQDLKQKIL